MSEKQNIEETEQISIKARDYACEVLLEDTTEEEANNPNFPNDAYNVYYTQEGKKYLDVCRGARVKIFDYYYDKYGKDVIQKIVWGYGKMNPKLWLENKKPKNKKR